MEDYTIKFYQFLPRNEVHEMEDQLVARYIGGLRVQIQETVNLFNPISMSVMHQMALQIENQLRRMSGGELLTNTSSSIGGVSCVTSSSGRVNMQVVVVWISVLALI